MSMNCPMCGAYIAPNNVITRQKYINQNPVVISEEFHCHEILSDELECDTQFRTDENGNIYY